MIKIDPEWRHWPETEALIAAFDAAGVPIRFVGGAVRDALLARPVTDVDAATPAPPQKVMSLLGAAGIKTIPTGLSHGTITAVVGVRGTGDGARSFEVTTLRRDIKNHGRHAEVLFTDSWEEDAARRDFTMNALYAEPDGTVHDPFGGAADAQAGRVIFIGEAAKRIQEDALRILRFFRFHAHYGEGEPYAEGVAACAAERQRLHALSGERVTQEMLKLLAAERAPQVLEMMQHAGILMEILPGVLDTGSLHAFARVRLMADIEAVDPLLTLALLLRGQNQTYSPIAPLIKRWRLSGKQSALLEFLATSPAIAAEADEAEQKKLLRHLGAEDFTALVLVSWSDRLSENPEKPQILAAAYRAMLALAAHWQAPEFPVSGNDLRALGVPPGPEMGRLLAHLEQIWEEEAYRPTKEMLLERLQNQPLSA